MRSSKKRKIAGVPMKAVHFKMRVDAYEKLCILGGQESFALTVEKMTEHYYERALKRQMLHIAK